MSKGWSKGLTKETDLSVKKISETFVARKIDNFQRWREVRDSCRPPQYFKLKQNGDLAELIGVVLGDGYIGQHARTQVLRIAGNSNHRGFIDRYSRLVEKVFAKTSSVRDCTDKYCTYITIYQNNIAERLGLQTGNKTNRPFFLPDWIFSSRIYTIRFLRGLYETDGCLSHHPATYTHKFTFRNYNQSLLELVFVLVSRLGFHATKGSTSVQISRKTEVEAVAKLLKFRHYE